MDDITIFHYSGFRNTGMCSSTDELIQRAFRIWTGGADLMPRIKRTGSGKPYIEGKGISFSVSHTGPDWYCSFGMRESGLDVEKMREIDFLKTADRFFSKGEQELCRKEGCVAFFRIWCRKEALVKYFGTTLGRGMSLFDTAPLGELVDTISIGSKTAFLVDLDMAKGCATALASEAPILRFSFEEF